MASYDIQVSGGRTLVARVSAGEGIPIVFLHGLFGSSGSWDDVGSGLTRPVVAFDLPGFGGSDLPTAPQVAAYADDIATGVRALGLDRFELVGHSFGGAVAAAVAELMPERVTSLLLLAAAGFGRIVLAEALTMRGVRSLAEARLPRLLERRHVVAEATPELMGAAFQATEALAAAGRSKTRSAAYGGPVTALWGTDDTVVRPSHSRGVVAAFPQAEVLLWEGMGHHPQRERREALLDLVKSPHGRSDQAPRRSKPARRRARRLLWPLPQLRLHPRFA